jgi:molybdopterin/thiamine biosynthesis adenylyltransferase
MDLSPQELARYSRQLIVEGWNQEKLKQSKIAIIGVGGLGGVTATYLASAGVGEIRLVDFDNVERSNLNRQILYSTDDIGLPKIQKAYQRLTKLNPEIKIVPNACRLDSANFAEIAAGCDLIIDGLDNHDSRLIINRAACQARIPYLYAAVNNWLGQISLFRPPQTGCLACFIPESLSVSQQTPVFGAIPGLVGSLQAIEALKHLMGIGSSLLNRLLIYHGDTQQTESLSLVANPHCKVCAT